MAGESVLRQPFNFVVEYIAVSHILKSASSPGEFSNCQLKELESAARTEKGNYIIHVALHKTGNTKQAQIYVKQDMWPIVQRYRNIMKRFKRPKKTLKATVQEVEILLAFPYASFTGFKVI